MPKELKNSHLHDVKTVFCTFSPQSGAVTWSNHAVSRLALPHDTSRTWFDLDVTGLATSDEIEVLVRRAALEGWFRLNRRDCRETVPHRLYRVTLPWDSGDSERGDYCIDVWAVSEQEAILETAIEMAQIANADTDLDIVVEAIVRGAGRYAVEDVYIRALVDLEKLLASSPSTLAMARSLLTGTDEAEERLVRPLA